MTDNPDWTDDEARTEFVNAEQCLWCKCDLGDRQGKSRTATLTTGERLCGNCLGDLREWKRTRFADILVSPTLEQSIRTALLDEWQDLMAVLMKIHDGDPKLKTLPTRTSNAHEHREHGDDSAGSDSL